MFLRSAFHHTIVAVGLFGLWVVLSGKLDPFHLGLGVVSALFVTLISGRRLYLEVTDEQGRTERHWLTFLPWHRVLLFLLTMAWEILRANVAVARKVLGPTSALRPQIFHLKPELHSELARVVLGYSIILTPGTTVLDVTPDGDFVVHALDLESAQDTSNGPLQGRVVWAFEPPEEG
jgi:multicomponent Na+:H+ antiporter subunit E